MPHDMLEPPLSELSGSRKVIFYDQLGCGNSDWPKDRSLWKLSRFVDDLERVISNLKLKRYHLLGHSFGTTLATSFALTKLKGMESLILSSPCLSAKVWEHETTKLLKLLPKKAQKAIADYEKYGKNKKAYDQAYKEYWARFLYKSENIPKLYWKLRSRYKRKINYEVYNTMWGPNEIKATGNMAGFDLSTRLHEIKVPVLLLCGRYDESTPESTKYFKNLFPNAQMKVFERSAHMTFWTDRTEFIKTVRIFLNKVGK